VYTAQQALAAVPRREIEGRRIKDRCANARVTVRQAKIGYVGHDPQLVKTVRRKRKVVDGSLGDSPWTVAMDGAAPGVATGLGLAKRGRLRLRRNERCTHDR
jgi:hypothetical protein